jgi:hypothetical protein
MSEIAKKIADAVLGLGLADKLGAFLYPAIALTSLILLFLALRSYKLLKICLPVFGGFMGYTVGSKAFATFVAEKLPDVAKLVDPKIAAGVACAVVFAILFMALRTVAILALGLGIGYAVLGEVAIDALKKLQFVRDIIINIDAKTAVMLAAIMSVLCGLVAMVLLKKFFNVFYTLATAIGFTVIAFVIPAIFITSGMDNAMKMVLMASDAGMVLGFIFFLKQYFRHRYFW